MTDRRELADRLEKLICHENHEGGCEAVRASCGCGYNERLFETALEAARLLREPVAGEVEAARLLRELCGEVHISPSGFITTSSFFIPLLKEARAFLRARLDDEGKGGDNGSGE